MESITDNMRRNAGRLSGAVDELIMNEVRQMLADDREQRRKDREDERQQLAVDRNKHLDDIRDTFDALKQDIAYLSTQIAQLESKLTTGMSMEEQMDNNMGFVYTPPSALASFRKKG